MPLVYISFTAKVGLCAVLLASGVLFVVGGRAPVDFLRVLLWTVAIGLLTFLAGFYGPLYFGPESPQGPLFGIFISGPAGAVIGSIVGLLLSIHHVRRDATTKT
jgi:hypothetical protein